MSGDRIAVNFGAVSNLASQINGQVQQVESQLETLRSAIQKLGTEWEGGANDAYTAVQNNWNNAADDLKSVLARIATAVGAAHDSYVQTENANTNTWS
ncbi:MAG TPA: WXG100 family type VII secretion target [Pseudonocardiaceae bacterium]|nr:WXG100 family type VII secretion target [Pseudonocardiaceae bacterium]